MSVNCLLVSRLFLVQMWRGAPSLKIMSWGRGLGVLGYKKLFISHLRTIIFFSHSIKEYILGAWVQVNFSHFWGGIYIYHNSSMPPPMDIISNGLGSWGHWRPQKPVGFPDYQRWILSFQESICNIRLLNSLSDIYKGKNKCPDRSYILGNYLIIFTMKTHTMFFFFFFKLQDFIYQR